jgi:hypothetical protein
VEQRNANLVASSRVEMKRFLSFLILPYIMASFGCSKLAYKGEPLPAASQKTKKTPSLTEIGWREKIQIPVFTNRKIKAKIDTGARTSALHVTNIKYFKKGRSQWVQFKVHPEQDSAKPAFLCESKVLEIRKIKSSTGHVTERPVIKVEMKLGTETFESELTLVNRDMMGFRMLLGRKALKNRFVVNVAKSYMGRKQKRTSK